MEAAEEQTETAALEDISTNVSRFLWLLLIWIWGTFIDLEYWYFLNCSSSYLTETNYQTGLGIFLFWIPSGHHTVFVCVQEIYTPICIKFWFLTWSARIPTGHISSKRVSTRMCIRLCKNRVSFMYTASIHVKCSDLAGQNSHQTYFPDFEDWG